ncbi:LamG domain-containing protein [Actinomadura violacea]|uniref:LamG domain-containing protein n=1 Tax=Actinomadura violacea TaxID=2819934 RepID=A0ABS3S809_9ACTN|nr:LamG domain-containing protein [Actinomadura violacea]MBO2464365.1 LamG domain-containing protein [Actinomadura violacea]
MRPRRRFATLLAALAVATPASLAAVPGSAWAGARSLMPAPAVTSADYPDDDAWHDGVGRYGDFTIDDPSDQAARYEVRLNDQKPLDLPTHDGAPVTVTIAPYRNGPNYLTVESFGPKGENGPPTQYDFLVNQGSAPKAHWKLDESAGARTLAAETRTGEDPLSTRVVGRVTTGVEGQFGTAARFAGGHAVTKPLVDTSKSFTLSAWAKPSGDGDATVVAEAGRHADAFALRSVGGHWAFVKSDSDSRGAATVQAVAEQPLYQDTWAHLVGSYDATQKRLRLYVNGLPAADVPSGGPAWDARSLRIGAGAPGRAQPFHGDVDEVRVHDRMVVPDEAARMAKVPSEVRGRWKFNTDGADDTTFGHPMTLHGGAAIDPEWGFYMSSPAGLLLNGDGAYADTAAPVMRTGESFTVAAWANVERWTGKPMTLLSLPGRNGNRLSVRYLPSEDPSWGKWQLVMTEADAPGAQTTVLENFNTQLWWDRVVVVYDAVTRTMRLYVNGNLDQDRSEKAGVGGFDATGGLQVGRSAFSDPEYWTGAVDDVWAFRGALTRTEVGYLSGGAEIDTPTAPWNGD